jgi:hypothetical protein
MVIRAKDGGCQPNPLPIDFGMSPFHHCSASKNNFLEDPQPPEPSACEELARKVTLVRCVDWLGGQGLGLARRFLGIRDLLTVSRSPL